MRGMKGAMDRTKCKYMLLAACLIFLAGQAGPALSATLTPEQVKQLQQLSPQQKAELARQAGVSAPASVSTPAVVEAPPVIKPRAVGETSLEQEVRSPSADKQAAPEPQKKQTVRYMSADYVLGPGDKLSLKIINRDGKQDYSLTIDEEGLVFLPGVEPLKLEGLPLQVARKLVAKKLAEVQSEISTVLKVILPRSPLPAFANFVRESKPLSVSTDLRQFGYELFAGAPTTFAPATDIPVPSEYIMGPGDELKVQLFGRLDQQLVMVVDREGAISFPEIGPLVVSGMSFAGVRAYIAEQIKEKMIGVSASITMGKLRSIRVFALGDVERPGSYTVSGLATLSHALFVSGGVKKIGSLRNVQLKRNGKRIAAIDLYDFLLKGDTSGDVRLLPGDVVFAPPIGRTVSIAGEVVRPAIYELRNETTISEVLKLAGGLRPTAYRDKALIERIGKGGEREVIEISLADGRTQTQVRKGDMIKVFSILGIEKNPVYLIGNVKRPGKYAWKDGMRISDLVPDNKSLLPETFMAYGVIEREAEGNREPELLRFNVEAVLAAKGSEADLIIRPRDKVYIFHRSHFREQPMVSIAGSVQSPGQYGLKKSMHLVDLILSSGGLLRDAYRDEAELYRTGPVTKEVTVRRYSLTQALKGDGENNPLLHDLDRVVIHSIWETRQQYQVSAVGEVKKPGDYVLAEGMHVADLVFAAGNVTEKSYLKSAEITRYEVVDGEKRVPRYIQIDLQAAMRGDEDANLLLQPYDMLYVRQVSNWRDIEQATVSGEVRFPGSYPIEDGESLSSLLERVGGFTADAYLPAAVFTRESIRAEQQKQLDELASRIEADISHQAAATGNIKDASILKRQQQALASAKQVQEQLKSVKATGRLVIRLKDIKKLKGTDFDLTLRQGDKLYVPKKPDQVLVMGQVYNNAALLYRKNLGRDDYIRMAGGTTRFADTSRTYIVRANGEMEPSHGWRSSRRIYPGDSIVVPQELERFHLLDSALDWSKVMYQISLSIVGLAYLGTL